MRPFCMLAVLDLLRLQHRATSPPRPRRARASAPLARLALGDVALEDPALHADHAVGRAGLGEAEVDVRAQRVQRHAALAVALAAAHLGAAEPTRASRGGCPSRRTSCVEVTAFFIARRNATRRSSCSAMFSATSCASSSALRISLMLMKISLVGEARELLAQRLDLGAALADQDARPRGVDVQHAPCRRSARSRPSRCRRGRASS